MQSVGCSAVCSFAKDPFVLVTGTNLLLIVLHSVSRRAFRVAVVVLAWVLISRVKGSLTSIEASLKPIISMVSMLSFSVSLSKFIYSLWNVLTGRWIDLPFQNHRDNSSIEVRRASGGDGPSLPLYMACQDCQGRSSDFMSESSPVSYQNQRGVTSEDLYLDGTWNNIGLGVPLGTPSIDGQDQERETSVGADSEEKFEEIWKACQPGFSPEDGQDEQKNGEIGVVSEQSVPALSADHQDQENRNAIEGGAETSSGEIGVECQPEAPPGDRQGQQQKALSERGIGSDSADGRNLPLPVVHRNQRAGSLVEKRLREFSKDDIEKLLKDGYFFSFLKSKL